MGGILIANSNGTKSKPQRGDITIHKDLFKFQKEKKGEKKNIEKTTYLTPHLKTL